MHRHRRQDDLAVAVAGSAATAGLTDMDSTAPAGCFTDQLPGRYNFVMSQAKPTLLIRGFRNLAAHTSAADRVSRSVMSRRVVDRVLLVGYGAAGRMAYLVGSMTMAGKFELFKDGQGKYRFG